MSKHFKPYDVDQRYLLPPDLREWLPEGHLAYFVVDVVGTLDLSGVYAGYAMGEGRGRPAYDPRMMVALLLYAYCVGRPSSRKIERATHEDVAFRVVAGDQHPDHDSIADFRKRHLGALAGLFVQVLLLCQKAGLVKLGHVALDGTKVKANASKHKAMSYQRMGETEARLAAEVARLLAEAESVDEEEDRLYGKGRRGDELPPELAFRETRLKKIREAKEALEREAKERAEREAEEARKRLEEREREERERGRKHGGRPPAVPDADQAKPGPKEQKNFTDPESRIMVDGATKGFIQGYNAQAAVDGEAQVIVAAAVTQATNDKRQAVPMLLKVQENVGRLPDKASADSGFFSEETVTDPRLANVVLLIPPEKHVTKQAAAQRMRERLETESGRADYKMRKAIVEPVFGQIKQARGFRAFSFRGLEQVSAEWSLVCLTHNLLKLFRAKPLLAPA